MTRRVFVSFVVEDQDLVNIFRGQAKNKNSDLEFSDYSVKEPVRQHERAVHPEQDSRAHRRGFSAHLPHRPDHVKRANGSNWELRTSQEEGNKVVGVQLHGLTAKNPTPQALTDLKVSVVNWDVAVIVKLIG